MYQIIESISRQQAIVTLLLLFCAVRIVYWVCGFFRHARSGESRCAGCAADCSLRDLRSNQSNRTFKRNQKKKCCG